MSQSMPNTVSRYVVRETNTFLKEPTIVGTQVTVRDVVELWRSGIAPEAIPAQLFNLVSVAQVFDVISFYLDNQPEIDGYIDWYRSHPPLNVPATLRLNPLRDEVNQSIKNYRQELDSAQSPVND
jgi:uncharacterized protein (DUF433 family)